MRTALVAMALVGCVQSGETICTDGTVCPGALVCDLTHHTCVTPDQLTSCAALEDGDDCPLTGGDIGVCDASVCLAQLCGDGLVTGAEDCDGETTASCMSLGYYDDVPLVCSPRCVFDVGVSQCSGFCGDGVVNGPAGTEACDGAPPNSTCLDLGFDRGPLECSAFCAPQFAACRDLGFVRRTPITSDHITGIYRASPTHTYYSSLFGVFEEGPGGVTYRPAAAFGVYGFGPNDVYSFGANGAIDHFDGTQWTRTSIGTEHQAMWGSGPNDIYVVGRNDRILRNTGSGWLDYDVIGTGQWLAVTGWGPSHVMVAGSSGRIRRFVNDVPQTEDTTDCFAAPAEQDRFNGLWGISPTDVFAVGRAGTICHYDGVAWTRQASGTTEDLNAVWGRAADDVFVIGSRGLVLHYDGAEWRQLDIDSVANFRALGAYGDELRIGGLFGEIYDYAGSALTTTALTLTGKRNATSPGPGHDYVAGGNLLYRWRDATWFEALNAGGRIAGLWVSVTGVVHLYAGSSLHRFEGTWAPPVLMPGAFYVEGLAGPDEENLFGFDGSGHVGHYDGTAWTTIATTSLKLADIGWAGGVAFVVGFDTSDRPRALLCSATACNETVLPGTQKATAIYAASATSAFAVGERGEIHHFDGTTWTAMTSGVIANLTDVGGTSPTDVFAVGDGVVLHYDGTAWSRVRVPFAQPFTTVAVRKDLVLIAGMASPTYTIVRDASW